MASLIDRLREYVSSEVTDREEEYEVDEYVLERVEPDPNPRIRTYDAPVEPDEVASGDAQSDDALPSGTYQLQEIKTSGMAGDVLWKVELTFDEPT